MRLALKLLILMMIVLAGCKTAETEKKISKSAALPGPKYDLEYLELDATIHSTMEGESNTIRASIHAAGRDSLRMVVYGPLGVIIGRLYADPEEFIFYSPFENRVYKGSPTAENFRKILNIDFGFADFVSILRNELPGDPTAYEPVEQEGFGEGILFRSGADEEYIQYAVISLNEQELVRYQRKDRRNELDMNVFFNKFDQIEGFRLARKIHMDFAKAASAFTLESPAITVNKAPKSVFRFAIPESANVINYD
ncbi:MAG: DUF4292 domain-containing protein [Candidatus Kapaibacterium sp.]